MDFTMKDFESVATGDSANVQFKKEFGIADVDAIKLEVITNSRVKRGYRYAQIYRIYELIS